jgi:hypothetical protein
VTIDVVEHHLDVCQQVALGVPRQLEAGDVVKEVLEHRARELPSPGQLDASQRAESLKLLERPQRVAHAGRCARLALQPVARPPL